MVFLLWEGSVLSKAFVSPTNRPLFPIDMSIADKTEYLKKIANSIEMSFEIPEAEKDIAEEAKIRFEAVIKTLRDNIEHLDIIYEPFKRHESVSTKSLVDKRGLLNRYKQKVKSNFNETKTVALLAIRKLDYFASGDISIQEIINSFIDSIEDVTPLPHNGCRPPKRRRV